MHTLAYTRRQAGSTPLSGTFTLEYDGEETADLPADSTASAVKAALETLDTVGTVEVTRATDPAAGYTWFVTFRVCRAPV